MQIHGNAKLVPSTRLLVVRRVLEESWKVGDVAAAQGGASRRRPFTSNCRRLPCRTGPDVPRLLVVLRGDRLLI